MDQIPIPEIQSYESELRQYISINETKLLNNINKEAKLTKSMVDELDRVLNMFYEKWIEQKGLPQ
jgi:F0F1-type ATP synthase alpha subunit